MQYISVCVRLCLCLKASRQNKSEEPSKLPTKSLKGPLEFQKLKPSLAGDVVFTSELFDGNHPEDKVGLLSWRINGWMIVEENCQQ